MRQKSCNSSSGIYFLIHKSHVGFPPRKFRREPDTFLPHTTTCLSSHPACFSTTVGEGRAENGALGANAGAPPAPAAATGGALWGRGSRPPQQPVTCGGRSRPGRAEPRSRPAPGPLPSSPVLPHRSPAAARRERGRWC